MPLAKFKRERLRCPRRPMRGGNRRTRGDSAPLHTPICTRICFPAAVPAHRRLQSALEYNGISRSVRWRKQVFGCNNFVITLHGNRQNPLPKGRVAKTDRRAEKRSAVRRRLFGTLTRSKIHYLPVPVSRIHPRLHKAVKGGIRSDAHLQLISNNISIGHVPFLGAIKHLRPYACIFADSGLYLFNLLYKLYVATIL